MVLVGLSRDVFVAVYFPDSHGLDSVHFVLFDGSTPAQLLLSDSTFLLNRQLNNHQHPHHHDVHHYEPILMAKIQQQQNIT
jgi:hypothetical protein